MTALQIVLLILLIVLLAFVAFLLISRYQMDKKATKFDTLGTVVRWQASKIPFLGHLIIEYTKKGKTYQTGSALMFKPKNPKFGIQYRWTVYVYHIPNKPPMSKAKPYNNKSATSSAPRSPFSTSHKK